MKKENPGITRGEFFKLAGGAAGVMASAFVHGVSEAVIDFERAKFIAIEALQKRHKKKAKFVFGDHAPLFHNPSTGNELLVGEITEWRLSTPPDESFDYLPEESRWIGGFEVGGRKRLQAFNDVVKSTKLLASTDGQLLIPDEYLPIMADESIKRVFLVLSLLVGGAAAGQIVIKKLSEIQEIDLQSRRQFLLHSLIAAILGTLSYRTGIDLLHHDRGIADLSQLPEEWQEIFSVVPYMDTAVPLRNKIMATNVNALAGLSLDDFVQNMTVFAGLGHTHLVHEFIKEPEDLHQELTEEMDQQLDSFFELYLKKTQYKSKQGFVTGYVGRGLGKLYFPVFVRLNQMLESPAEEIGIAQALSQSISITERLFQFLESHISYPTASLLFLERLYAFPLRNRYADNRAKLEYTHDIAQILAPLWNTKQILGIDVSRNFALLLPSTPELPQQSIAIGNVQFRHQRGFVNGIQRL